MTSQEASELRHQELCLTMLVSGMMQHPRADIYSLTGQQELVNKATTAFGYIRGILRSKNPPPDEKVLVQIYLSRGDVPFIFDVRGRCTVDILQKVETDFVKDYIEDHYLKEGTDSKTLLAEIRFDAIKYTPHSDNEPDRPYLLVIAPGKNSHER